VPAAIWAKIRSRGGYWSGLSRRHDLRYAYADALLADGQQADARHWFASAAKLDHDQQTDAQQRIDELDGFLIDYDEGDEDDSQPSHEPGRDLLP
jgi:hypothetical protein